ncbi:MAG: acylneuraminate cytidylyltransferase [Pseudomonadota bacterium]|nr:acylneuraminate cytidylyltransferase [Pseudomonadota bacterium]
MTDKIGVILQARMNSSRLPGKVLKPFFHTTLLGWILERLVNLPYQIITATSICNQDDAIEDFCLKRGEKCFRGSELNVLDRFYQCAISNQFVHVIRLTGDNPFPDEKVIRDITELHISNSASYTHAFGDLPIGVGCEIISFQALKHSWEKAKQPHFKEHVNEFILNNPEYFRIEKLTVSEENIKPDLSLTIDTEEDYNRILGYFKSKPDPKINTKELISECSSSA